MKIYLVKIAAFFLLTLMLLSCDRTNYDGHLYIVSRNSKSKEGNLVLKYNSTPNDISHIGITFSKDIDAYVYNVSYDSINGFGSSLIKERIDFFWSSPNNKDNRIWSLPISKEEYERLKEYIKKLEKEKIHFDFDPKTNLGLYCSEFVYNALVFANNKKFTVKPIGKKLKGYERLITNEEYLSYYPADFFLEYLKIKEL
ncbi:hypothetical protein [Aquimarina macrocephali]|uniref:hypothetical protein n=1 Tax=Aquimarina macrocephali TaxID=666563 RepID=UPI000463E8E9|nr:hypothetical protein [Aquimarina macrocephali]